MDEPSDKRYRSFLWSQTKKSFYGETRLSLPGDSTGVAARAFETPPAGSVSPIPAPPMVSEPPPGIKKVKLTRLDQAVMRMSEHCIAPAPKPKVENPDAAAPEWPPSPAVADTGWVLHVRLRLGSDLPTSVASTQHYLGLNVTKAMRE